MKLAEKIYQERRKLGLSQEQFAERMDISRQAVSKWESGQSMPDLDKIVAMSQIFGVSTDYLLKEDESVSEEVAGDVESDIYQEVDEEVAMKYEEKPEMLQELSVDEINSYKKTYISSTKHIALGVFLCILGAAFVELTEVLSVSLFSVNGETLASFPMLICVTIAVALFVPSGMVLSKYEYLQKVPFVLPQGEKQRIEEEMDSFQRKFAVGITVGIVLILFGVLSGVGMEYATEVTGNEIWDDSVSGIILLFFVAVGVYLFVRCGMKMGMYNVLLQREEYSVSRKKNVDKKDTLMGLVAGVYWCLITALFLAYSFITRDWGRSWIIWPVAGCVFGAIATFIALSEKKDKE
ncbi:MAG: helix-turn-helix transcriptional regulator [Lachnospiraceae bacterium]|nr:helix-turn-helix transcriptional regulator [Lachnospiraceae bacterium]